MNADEIRDCLKNGQVSSKTLKALSLLSLDARGQKMKNIIPLYPTMTWCNRKCKKPKVLPMQRKPPESEEIILITLLASSNAISKSDFLITFFSSFSNSLVRFLFRDV